MFRHPPLPLCLLLFALGACGDAGLKNETMTSGPPFEATDDGDGDGYSLTDDCDDTDAAVNPGAEEAPHAGGDDLRGRALPRARA